MQATPQVVSKPRPPRLIAQQRLLQRLRNLTPEQAALRWRLLSQPNVNRLAA